MISWHLGRGQALLEGDVVAVAYVEVHGGGVGPLLSSGGQVA